MSRLGLAIADSKDLLSTTQQHLIAMEVRALSEQQGDCPHRAAPAERKDVQPVCYRTMCGKYSNAKGHFATRDCGKEQKKKLFSALTEALAALVHP